ncbi:MAG: class I SAM-dependent methyltransferase [Deltaproteobacteria bacterium]|nr:class I SAM-dependent methyltransferase [Deltaproteobacteria bacterium]
MNEKAESNQENFSEKLTDILNYGALNLGLGLGYRTRLFDIMDGFDTPQPAAIIAEKAGLSERYVLEWLGIMVTGGVVDLFNDQGGQALFQLPKAHADLITRRAGNNNMGVYMQEIPLLTATVFEAVENGFKTGDGISYEMYPGFQRFMTELADAKHRQVLVSQFLPSVKSGEMIEKLKNGISVCDMGCGEGVALMLMAEAFPKSQFLGIDISESVILKATSTAKELGLRNVTFRKRDAAVLTRDRELHKSLDYVTAFDAIHDQTKPMNALEGIYAILKDGGVFSMVDIAASSDLEKNMDHPMGMFLYTVSLMHCMPVGLADGGMGLGMMWGREKAVSMLKEAGFADVSVEEIPEDPFNLHFFCTKKGKDTA